MMASHEPEAQARLSQAKLVQLRLSQFRLSQAKSSQTRLVQLNWLQSMPFNVGFFQTRGWPLSSGYNVCAAGFATRKPWLPDRAVATRLAACSSRTPRPAIGPGTLTPANWPNGAAVAVRMPLTWLGFRPGCACSKRATTPEATPVAMDVPLRRKYCAPLAAVTTRSGFSTSSVLPGTRSETIRRPGATMSG